MTFIIVIHVIVCIALIGLVLIQRGRGSGLIESFHSVESMFGTKTNTFLTRTTTILSIIFFFTCLSLAVLSVRQSKSLMSNVKPEGGGLASDSQSHKPEGGGLASDSQSHNTQAPAKQATQETDKPQEKSAVTQLAPQKEEAPAP
ncbi:MAG: preprotein translocase subunit SecG [Candidatus Omnitrophota bacterium]